MSETTPQDATALRRELRTYIEEAFLYLHPGVELGDGDEFLELGIIDSLGFVELVEEVQARYGVAVDDVEITEENFGSLDALVAFVARKRGEAAA
jgi:acyl carrier protein